MDLRERAKDGRIRTRHPWEVARMEHVRDVLAARLEQRSTVLDVGAGDGFVASELHRALPQLEQIVCWDLHYTPDDLAEQDGVVSRVTALPTNRYDVLLMLDVLEHVEDSVGLLRLLRDEACAPPAIAIITVPAHPRLFSAHDTSLGHVRRYSRRLLRAELEAAGWEVQQLGGFFVVPLLARWTSLRFGRAAHKLTAPSGEVADWRGGPVLTWLVLRALRLDAWLGRFFAQRSLQWPGLSYWAVARPAT